MSKLIDPTPCAICGSLMSIVDFEDQKAVALFDGPQLTAIAHANHFFDGYEGYEQKTPDYDLNIEKLVRVAAIKLQEGKDARPAG